MNSVGDWSHYFGLVVAAFMAGVLPLLASLLSPKAAKNATPEVEVLPSSRSRKTLIRFCGPLILVAPFVAMALLLLPLASALRSNSVAVGAAAVVSVSLFMGFGLLYTSRKGDLDWYKEARNDDGQISDRG